MIIPQWLQGAEGSALVFLLSALLFFVATLFRALPASFSCAATPWSLDFITLSFLFCLAVCRDFHKYLNANVKKKKRFSFLLTHFLFWLVLWANPSAVIQAGDAQPACVISVTHEFLLLRAEPPNSWLPGLQKPSRFAWFSHWFPLEQDMQPGECSSALVLGSEGLERFLITQS